MNESTLFISHSSKDELVAIAFSDFMTGVGIPESQIMCTSACGTHIAAGDPLYQTLRRTLSQKSTLFLALLSDNYYLSATCLNEMGAAWVKSLEGFFFILPGFSFDKVRGVILENQSIGISFTPINQMTTERLYDFKKGIESKFGIQIESRLWEREREKFYQKIREYSDLIRKFFYIDKIKGLCIGEFEHDGCKIIGNCPSRIVANIDFSLTRASLCSIVIPTYTHDWTNFASNKKYIRFSAYTNMDLLYAEVEIALNTTYQYPITLTNRKTDYNIPLDKFSSNLSDFSKVENICFLFFRNKTPTSQSVIEIIIENITLSE